MKVNNKIVGNDIDEIISNIDKLVGKLETGRWAFQRKVEIRSVCDELSIFDWWNEYISISQLNSMKTFLNQAKKLGFKGYACFKVGAAGCSNGMWVHKEKSADGYSPKGPAIYKSFVSSYNYWDVDPNGEGFVGRQFKNAKEVREFLASKGVLAESEK